MSHLFTNTSSGFWPRFIAFSKYSSRDDAFMSTSNAEGRQAGGLNPQGLRLEDLAQILSALGPKAVTVTMLRDDVAAGAPTNADGTMNLVQYSAWLLRENADAGN
jgi:hypothetical protein